MFEGSHHIPYMAASVVTAIGMNNKDISDVSKCLDNNMSQRGTLAVTRKCCKLIYLCG